MFEELEESHTLSVIIPCYNEQDTIHAIVSKVEEVDIGEISKEIIIVDDGSSDGSRDIIRQMRDHTVVFHERNKGKGAAVHTGLEHASGSVLLVQDADLELDPFDYPDLLKPIVHGESLVVYGNRHRASGQRLRLFFLGGQFLRFSTYLLYGTHIHDPMVGYKVFHRDVLENIELKEPGFEFCADFTGQVLKNNISISQVPVRYYPRTKEEGKKLSYRDGIRWLWVLVKHAV